MIRWSQALRRGGGGLHPLLGLRILAFGQEGTDAGEDLLHLIEAGHDLIAVAGQDVPPHDRVARGDPRGVPQARAGAVEGLIAACQVDQAARHQVRHVAHPRDGLVVGSWREDRHSTAQGLPELLEQSGGGIGPAAGGTHEACGVVEKVCPGKLHAGPLAARHGGASRRIVPSGPGAARPTAAAHVSYYRHL